MSGLALTVEQYAWALKIAKFRHERGIQRGRTPRWGQTRSMEDDLHGAICEAGVAVFMGDFEHWASRQAADTWGPDTKWYEIRGTKYQTGKLILHKDERYPDSPVILAHSFIGSSVVTPLGCLPSMRNGMVEKYWGCPRGFRNEVYAIPQEDLYCVNQFRFDLKRGVEGGMGWK